MTTLYLYQPSHGTRSKRSVRQDWTWIGDGRTEPHRVNQIASSKVLDIVVRSDLVPCVILPSPTDTTYETSRDSRTGAFCGIDNYGRLGRQVVPSVSNVGTPHPRS